MSIFDVIRYPISRIPTEEELRALPRRIFEKWRRKVGKSAAFGPKEMSVFYSEIWDLEDDIILLRTMIKRMRK